MKAKVGIAICQSIAPSMAFTPHCKILLKGHFTMNTKQFSIRKAGKCQIVWTILFAAFFCVRLIPDDTILYM